MLAIIASVLLGLYIFVPDFFFDRFTGKYTRLKRKTRTKTEEVVSGIVVALIPFGLALALIHVAWVPSQYPFPIPGDSIGQKQSDYETVTSGLMSDEHFKMHYQQFWPAFYRCVDRQARLLVWMYLFLTVEILIVRWATTKFGDLSQRAWFAWLFGEPILKRASEWEPLLTPFVFPSAERRHVELDVMTVDNHLYRGTVGDYFLNPTDGDLSGILLVKTSRFQFQRLEDDREKGKKIVTSDYWKDIPGSKFYIPAASIANINFRYELPETDFLQILRDALKSVPGLKNVKVTKSNPAANESDKITGGGGQGT